MQQVQVLYTTGAMNHSAAPSMNSWKGAVFRALGLEAEALSKEPQTQRFCRSREAGTSSQESQTRRYYRSREAGTSSQESQTRRFCGSREVGTSSQESQTRRFCGSGDTRSLQESQTPARFPQASLQTHAPMDPEIWRHLPLHLLDSIFIRLPLPSLLKLRSVCKRFNNILYSPALFATRGDCASASWYLFRGEGRECVTFNPDTDCWLKLPLGFLPSAKGRVVATAGGLLCVRQGERMVVCNPVSKAWVELPPRKNTWKFPIVGMVMDKEVQEYKVVVAGRNSTCGKNLVTEVYSSITKTWKDVETHPVEHHYQTSAVYSNGFLYSAGFDGILAFDLGLEQWREMKGPSMQDTQLMLPQICECNGTLLMVEVVSEQCHFLMTRVSVWALRVGEHQWCKLTSMPQKVLEEVISISGTRLFTYFGHGDYICFTIARRRVLVYSMSKKMWRWLPRCPFVQGFARRFTTLAYEPRVEAQV